VTRKSFALGTAVLFGLVASFILATFVVSADEPVLGSDEMAHVLLGAGLFVVYLFGLTALVRAYGDGDLPAGFSTGGAQYGDIAKVGSKLEEQVLELNARLDDQANLLEVSIRQIDHRISEVEGRLP
jgi:hypothetical protein